jgi:hypothetical protein
MSKALKLQLKLVIWVLFIAGLGACKKEKSSQSDKIELLSYGPAGVKHGEKIRFIGKNLDKVNSIEFVGAIVEKSGFEQQSSELIVLVVPEAAERGVVVLKGIGGDVTSKAPIDFDVPFTISSFTPSVKPGENITINGDFLNWITAVNFRDDTLVTEFVSQTLNELVIKVPMNAKSGPLIFYGAGTEPVTYESENELNVRLPAIDSFAPEIIQPLGTLRITGSDLDLVRDITLPGVGTPITEFESRSLTEIVMNIPAATQAGKISLQSYSGISIISGSDLIVKLPVLTNFSPTLVERGQQIVIQGKDLDLVTAVVFKGSDPVSEFAERSTTQIVVNVPADANKGVIALQAISGVLTESVAIMEIMGDLPPLAPLGVAIYDDVLKSSWQKWGGWGGGAADIASSDNVRDGEKSIKVSFAGGWSGALQFGAGNTSTNGFTQFVISIFGTTGTGGKKINLTVKGGSIEQKEITIVEGEWTEYKFSLLNDFGNPAVITEIQLQDQGWAGIIHVDHIGLR